MTITAHQRALLATLAASPDGLTWTALKSAGIRLTTGILVSTMKRGWVENTVKGDLEGPFRLTATGRAAMEGA